MESTEGATLLRRNCAYALYQGLTLVNACMRTPTLDRSGDFSWTEDTQIAMVIVVLTLSCEAGNARRKAWRELVLGYFPVVPEKHSSISRKRYLVGEIATHGQVSYTADRHQLE
jgi:hypothetical protein